MHEAMCVSTDGDLKVYRKILADGSLAVGLFNRGARPATVTAKWSDLGIDGKRLVRDVWREEDLGTFDTAFSASVHSHGVELVRISPAK